MKKLITLFAALFVIGCNWGNSGCDKCSCEAGCCDSGSCGTEDCVCVCKN